MKKLPEGWRRLRLGDIAMVRDGAHITPDYLAEGIPFLRVCDIAAKEVDLSSVKRISRQEYEQLTKTLRPQQGDILLSKNGTIGVPRVVDWDWPFACFVSLALLRIKNTEMVSADYLFEVLKSPVVQREMRLRAKAGTVTNLHLEEIKELQIPLPDNKQQAELVGWARRWQSGIDTLEDLSEAAKQRKRGLMQQLLTGRKRFKEFVKTAQQVRTRYGFFPSDWSAVHMGDIANEISEKNDRGEDFPVLSCTKNRGLVNSLEYFGKRIFSADTSNYRVVRRGDFAYATNHIEEGSIGYQDLHDAALISPMYTVFRTQPGVDHAFFFKLVKTELYRHIFEVNTSGSIARRGGLRWDEFALIKVFLPPVPEQKRIAAVLETCDREIELLQKQLDALKEQKRGLMQKLLTGEVRAKVKG